MRSLALQEFLDAAKLAYSARATDPRSNRSLSRIFADLETPAPHSEPEARRLPVCHHLDTVIAPSEADAPDLQDLLRAFIAIEPSLRWRPRQGDCTGASANFFENHANAMILGPGGLEPRDDVWLGVSLVGPNVLYPDHRHPPEETYLVIGPGDFRQGRTAWTHVARGETYYNPHNIVHAMRSSQDPLLAFWALRE